MQKSWFWKIFSDFSKIIWGGGGVKPIFAPSTLGLEGRPPPSYPSLGGGMQKSINNAQLLRTKSTVKVLLADSNININ